MRRRCFNQESPSLVRRPFPKIRRLNCGTAYARLMKSLVVGYQNLLDEVGVVQEIDVTGKSAIVKDVTKLTSPLRIQPEWVRASQREVPDYAAIHWPGRTNQGHHHRPVVSASPVDFARSRLRMPMILNQDFESVMISHSPTVGNAGRHCNRCARIWRRARKRKQN